MTTTLESPQGVLHEPSTGHVEVQERLTELADALLTAVERRGPHHVQQRDLVRYLRETVLPHLDVETELVLARFDVHGGSYTRAVAAEHRLLVAVVDELDSCRAGIDAAALAGAVVVLCDKRFRQEDEHMFRRELDETRSHR